MNTINNQNYICLDCEQQKRNVSFFDKTVFVIKNKSFAVCDLVKNNVLKDKVDSVAFVAFVVSSAALAVLAGIVFFTTSSPALIVGSLIAGVFFSAILIVVPKVMGFFVAEKVEVLFKNYHLNQMPKNSDVALVLEAEEDHNNAYRYTQSVHKLHQKYALVFRKIASAKDIQKYINETVSNANTIKILWIRGHGSQFGVQLSKKRKLRVDHVNKLAQSFQKLDPKCSIVFEACSTGKGNSNLASAMALSAKGRQVIASKDTLSILNVKIISVKPLKIEMLKSNKVTNTSLSKRPFFTRFYHKVKLFYLNRNTKEDMAVRYISTDTK